nr:recombinase family protein [Clostridiales bacterium]
LKNEKYKGDFLCQKTYHTEVFPFRQKRNRGEEDQYYIEESHKGIVRNDIFDKANEIMSARREKYRSLCGNGDEKKEYALSGRIFCAECGSAFVRKASRGVVYRVCSRHLEAREECPSHYISENRIENAFMIMLNKLTYRETDIVSFVISLLEEAVFAGKKDNAEALDASRQMADLSSKLLMFEQLHSKGYIAPDVYVSKKKELSSKILLLQGERARMLDGLLTKRFDELGKLRSILSEIKDPGLDFNEDAFRNIVSAVMIDRNDKAEFTLTGGLKFIEQL